MFSLRTPVSCFISVVYFFSNERCIFDFFFDPLNTDTPLIWTLFLASVLTELDCTVRNIPKFKDRANWSCNTFQPMRRPACVYQQTNQNIAAVIKYFQNSGRSRTKSVIVSRLSGIFLRLFMRHTQFF